jgi:hypothetical protein
MGGRGTGTSDKPKKGPADELRGGCASAIKRQPEGSDPVQLALKRKEKTRNLCDFSFNQDKEKRIDSGANSVD